MVNGLRVILDELSRIAAEPKLCAVVQHMKQDRTAVWRAQAGELATLYFPLIGLAQVRSRPCLATCRTVIRELENDNEAFLTWFRSGFLGLLGPELDAYIAQVLLGMRKTRKEICLPGDMTVIRKRKEVSLAGLPEQQVLNTLVDWARARRKSDQNANGIESGVNQFSAADDRLVSTRLCFSLLRHSNVNWDDVSKCLDDRTASELEEVLSGCSVEEMGKTRYNHFRKQLPRIRKVIVDLHQKPTFSQEVRNASAVSFHARRRAQRARKSI